MSSHPNRVPVVEVYRLSSGRWWWECWSEQHHPGLTAFGKHETHAEALEAALNHCKKANQP